MKKSILLSLLAGAALSNAALAAEPMSRDEVRSMVTEMLADADTRSSLLQGGGVAGYDKGFVVRSPDGAYSVKLNGLVQFRYVASFRDVPEDGTGGDDFTHSFQLRKSYLNFSGNLVNSDLTYVIRLQQERSDAVVTRDVYAQYNYGQGIKVRAGQYKVNFLKEELNGDGDTLGVERGVVNSVFNQGRSQGVGMSWAINDDIDVFADFTDGFRSNGTDLNAAGVAEYAVTGRLNWKIMGSKDDLRTYTSKVGSATSAQVGVAAHFQAAQEGAGLTGGLPSFPLGDLFAWTIDGQIEGGGFGAFAALVGQHTNGYNAVANDGTNNSTSIYGLTAQGSWRWDAAPEIFVKYDGIYTQDNNFDPENYHFISFGFNNYYADNAAKFTIDAIVALNETAGATVFGGLSGTSLGLNGSAETGEFAIRAQLQLLF